MNGATKDFSSNQDISEEYHSFQQKKPKNSQKKTSTPGPNHLDILN